MGLLSQMNDPMVNDSDRVLLTTNKCGFRMRHLMLSLVDILPHGIKESKCSKVMDALEMAEMNECRYFIHLEEKKDESYLYMADKEGCGIQFLVLNVHTLEELKFNGNCIKHSRMILSFSDKFDTPELQLTKHMLSKIFEVPKVGKTKPFIDHLMHFNICDGKIWIRHFEMKGGEKLIEIGPRVTLWPLRVFAGPCKGEVLYSNPHYVSQHKLNVYERKISRKNDGREKKNFVTEVDDDTIFKK